MKSGRLKRDKGNISTLGVSKNSVDSEVLSGQLRANDINTIHENSKMDHNIVIINTCGFIDKAKEESINTILENVALKKKGKLDKVYAVSYTHLRAHETVLDLVCRLLLEKKNNRHSSR